MSQTAADLVFREKMSGPLTLGETDPLAGAGKGRQTPFTFRATIRVDDMDAFVRDPRHLAQLDARISFTPWGEDLPVTRGTFNLFKAGDAPDTRLMVYGMTFEVDGRSYHLQGTKTIHDDRGFDLWHDTTRLYCHLHEGTSESGRVVGAGVLKLGVRDVLSIVRSMHSERHQGMEEVEAIGKFGRFFLGTLWDVYAPLAREAQAPSGTEAPSAP
jgi:hypothetical protein